LLPLPNVHIRELFEKVTLFYDTILVENNVLPHMHGYLSLLQGKACERLIGLEEFLLSNCGIISKIKVYMKNIALFTH